MSYLYINRDKIWTKYVKIGRVTPRYISHSINFLHCSKYFNNSPLVNAKFWFCSIQNYVRLCKVYFLWHIKISYLLQAISKPWKYFNIFISFIIKHFPNNLSLLTSSSYHSLQLSYNQHLLKLLIWIFPSVKVNNESDILSLHESYSLYLRIHFPKW